MWGLPEDLLKAYYKYASNYLGWLKDFYTILYLSLYASLQLIISVIGSLVFLI